MIHTVDWHNDLKNSCGKMLSNACQLHNDIMNRKTKLDE